MTIYTYPHKNYNFYYRTIIIKVNILTTEVNRKNHINISDFLLIVFDVTTLKKIIDSKVFCHFSHGFRGSSYEL